MSINGVGGFGKRFIKDRAEVTEDSNTQALYEELSSVFQSKTDAVSQMAILKSEKKPEDSEASAEIQELTSALADAQSSYSEAVSGFSSASSAATSATAEAVSLAAAAAATPKTINVPVDTGEKDANGNSITKVEEQPNPAYEAAKAAADEAQAMADQAQAQLQVAQQKLQSAQAVVEETQVALAELQNAEDNPTLDGEDENLEVEQLQEKIDEFDKQIENIKAKIASVKQFDIADSKVDDSKKPLSYRDNFGNAVVEAALVGGGQIQTTKRADGSTVQKITKPDGSVVQVIKKEGRPEEIHTYASPETASKNDKADRREKEAGAEEAKVTDDVKAEETKQEDAIKATAKTSKDCLVDPIGLTDGEGSKYDFIIDDGDFSDASDFLGSKTGLGALAKIAGDDNIVTAEELKSALVKKDDGDEQEYPLMVVATYTDGHQQKISIEKMMQELGIDNFEITVGEKDDSLKVDYTPGQGINIAGHNTWYDNDTLNNTYHYNIDDEPNAHDMKDVNRGKIVLKGTSVVNGAIEAVEDDELDTDVYYDNRGDLSKEDYFEKTTFDIMKDIGTYIGATDENGDIDDYYELANAFSQVAENNSITVDYSSDDFLLGVSYDKFVTPFTEAEQGILFPDGENDSGTALSAIIEEVFSKNPTEWPEDKRELYAKLYSMGIANEMAKVSWNGKLGDDLFGLKGVNHTESSSDVTAGDDTVAASQPTDTAAATEDSSEQTDGDSPAILAPKDLEIDPDAFYGIQINTEGILTIAGVEGLTVNNDNDLEKLQKADYGTYSLKDSAGRNVKVEITEGGAISVKQEVVVDGEDDSSVEYVTTAYNSKNNTWYRLVTTDDKVVESQTRIYKDSGKVDSWENKEYFKDVPAGFDASCKVTRSDGTYIEKTIGDTLSYFDANDMYELSSPEEAIIATQVIKNYQDSNFASLSPSEKLLIKNEDIPTLDEAIEGVKSGKYDDKTDFDLMFSEFKLDDTNFSDLSDDEKSDLYQMMEYYDILQTLGINDLDNDSKKIVKDFENYIKFLYGHSISTEVSQNLKGNLRNICRKLGVDMSKLVSGTDNQNFVFDNNTYDRNIEFNVRLDTDNGIAITTAYNTSSALDLNSPVINSSAKSSTIAADIEEADSSSPESGIEETESADNAPEEPTDNKPTELGNEQFDLEDKLNSIDEFKASILGNDDDLSLYANKLLQNGKAEYTDNAGVKHTLRYDGGILYCDDEEII